MKPPNLHSLPLSEPLASLPTAEVVRSRLALIFAEASLLRSLLRLLERAERYRGRGDTRRADGEGVRNAG